MALPISPGDIVGIAKFAWDLYEACQAAPDQFAAVGREASGMRFILRSLKMYVLDKKDSIFKAGNKDGAELLQQLEEQTGRCLSSLIQLEEVLKKYESTEALGWWLRWLARGKAEVAEVQAQMESSTTQLNTFCKDVIIVWGLAVVNANVKNVEKLIKGNAKNVEKLIKGMGLDVIEDALRRHPDNEKKAIKEVMGVVGRSSSREDAREYKTLIQEYIEEVKKSRKADGKGRRAQTSEGRGRNDNDGQLGVPNTDKRPQSAEPGKKDQGKKNAPAKEAKTKAPSFTFECWLVKSFSAKRKKQNRGQEQLKDMAEKFQASQSCLDENHSLVRSVLDDKNPDEDTRYKWYYCASRVERVERGEQIMVIVKRRLTPEALEKQDEKERKEAAKKRKEEKEKKEDRKKKEETEKKGKASEKKRNQDGVRTADVEGKQGDGKDRKKKEEAKNKEEASEKKRTQDRKADVEGKQGDGKDRKKKEETKKKEEASEEKKNRDGVRKADVEGKQGDGKDQPKKEEKEKEEDRKKKEETKKKEEASKGKKNQDGVRKADVEGKQRDRKDQPKKEEKEKEEDRKKKEETKKKEEASKKKKEDQDRVRKADVEGKQRDGKDQPKKDIKGNNGQAKPKVQGKKEQPDGEKKDDKKPMNVPGQNNLHPDDAHGKDKKGNHHHDEKKHKDKSPSPAPAKGKH